MHPFPGSKMALTLQDVLARTSAPPPTPLSHNEAMTALKRAKRQTRRRGDVFAQLHAGKIPPDQVETVLLRHVDHAFRALDHPSRSALLELLLHLEEHAPDVLSLAWGTDRLGPTEGNSLIQGVIGLARHHASWSRPLTTWRPDHRSERRQFTELARYLLARYPVPTFFDVVWFASGDQAHRQQNWYVHIGSGGNIRTAGDLPLHLTKRMAHEVQNAPEDSTMTEALRYAQVVGAGGTEALAAVVNSTRLGRSFDHEPFWATVVPFLVRHHACLPDDELRAIVEYLHHRRFLHQDIVAPDGTLMKGPPAEPNLSMKSRSLPKLRGLVERWRQAWAHDFEVDDEPTTYNGRRLAHLYLETEDERTGQVLIWTIQELRSPRALANEGQAMGHCLSSKAVSLSTTSIWSVQVRDGDRSRRVMTLAIDIEQRYVKEARGRFNANPDRDVDGPAINLNEHAGGARAQGRLGPREKELLRQAHAVVRLWLDREEIVESKYDV